MNSLTTINVPFYGNNLYVVNYNGQPYIPMRPIVEGIGVDWTGQLNKLKQRFKSTIEEISIVAADGKERNMICLALRKLAGWLNTISPNKVKPEIRANVIRYQEECDDVLYEYWTKGEVKPKSKTTTNQRTPLRDAVNMLVGKKGIMYPEAYSFIHQRFNVAHIDDLAPEQLPAAIEYIHKLALEGEYLGKVELPAPKTGLMLNDYQLYDIFLLTHRLKWAYNIFCEYNLKEHLSGLGCPAGFRIHEHLALGVMASKTLTAIEPELEAVRQRLGITH